MQVFHTAGDPPSSGRIILATIGSTMNTSAALVKIALAKMAGAKRTRVIAKSARAIDHTP